MLHKIAAVLHDHPKVLTMWREAMKPSVGRKPQSVDNVNALETPKGNSRSYTLSRLEKQAKDRQKQGKENLPDPSEAGSPESWGLQV